jgi:hypothetical protein
VILGERGFVGAIHPAHHSWRILGRKMACIHIHLATWLVGVKGSHLRVQIPIIPLCR